MREMLVALGFSLLGAAAGAERLPWRPWDPAIGATPLAALLAQDPDLAESLELVIPREPDDPVQDPPPGPSRMELIAVDLDGDGRAEVFLRYPSGYCGSAGCRYALMAPTPEGGWRKACDGNADEQIELRPGRSAGWREYADRFIQYRWYRPQARPEAVECFARRHLCEYCWFEGGWYQLSAAEFRAIGWQDRHGRWTPLAAAYGLRGHQPINDNLPAQEAAFSATLRYWEARLQQLGVLRHAGLIVDALDAGNSTVVLRTIGLALAARDHGTETVALYVRDRLAAMRLPPDQRERAYPPTLRQRLLAVERELERFERWPREATERRRR